MTKFAENRQPFAVPARWRMVSLCVAVAAFAALVATASAAFNAPVFLSASGVSNPEVATDDSGDAIAVWERESNDRIEARQVSAAGVLGPVTTISGLFSARPEVATDADGDSIAVWINFDFNVSKNRIQARQISAAGILGSTKNLSASGQNADEAQVATDADGDSIVVWSRPDSAGAHPRIQARQVSAAGVLGPIRTLSAAGDSGSEPQVASDTDGDAIVTWSLHETATGNSRVQGKQVSAAGSVGPMLNLSPANANNGDVASDADGDSIAVYIRYDGSAERAQARRVSAAGVMSAPQTLSPAGASASDTHVATDLTGDATAVWVRPNANSIDRIQARQVSAAGVVGAVETLSTGHGTQPQVDTDNDGDAIALWRHFDFVGGGAEVRAREISSAGVLGSEATLGVTPTGFLPSGPQVATDADGDSIAAWLSPTGSPNRIQAAQEPQTP